MPKLKRDVPTVTIINVFSIFGDVSSFKRFASMLRHWFKR